MISYNTLRKAAYEIIERTKGDITKMTLSDIITMKLAARAMLNNASIPDLDFDDLTTQYLMTWMLFDIEKWVASEGLGVNERIEKAMNLAYSR